MGRGGQPAKHPFHAIAGKDAVELPFFGLGQREQTLQLEQRRLQQFLSAIEASPNGVLILDASEQIVWCNSVSADHFGLDPQRDRRQRVTNLVRSPAFVAYLQQQSFAEPVNFPNPRGDGTLSVLLFVLRP